MKRIPFEIIFFSLLRFKHSYILLNFSLYFSVRILKVEISKEDSPKNFQDVQQLGSYNVEEKNR